MEALLTFMVYPTVVVLVSATVMGGFKLFMSTVKALSDITNTQVALQSSLEKLDERVTHLERTR